MTESGWTSPGPEGELRPIAPGERIDVVDLLRGLAILGILFVNMGSFSFPEESGRFARELFPGIVDRVVTWSVRFFVEAKFYSLFSFLFGLGAAVQMSRARLRGVPFTPLYTRRLLVLLVIGLIHDILLWNGAILVAYATLGFLILPFRDRRPETLLKWAAGLVLVPVLLFAIALPISEVVRRETDATLTVEEARSREDQEVREEFERQIELFRDGPYLDMVAFRIGQLPRTMGTIVGLGSYVLALFLLGAWAWRRELFQKVEENRTLIRRVLVWSLAPGIIGNGVFLLIRAAYPSRPPVPLAILGVLLRQIGSLSLCLFYIAAVVLLVRKAVVRKALAPLAAVGRTALSNYLFQTVVCTTIFYSYGLGWFGTTGPALNLVLTLVIFVVQLIASAWWVRRFRFGPAEWLWRSLTYRRMPA